MLTAPAFASRSSIPLAESLTADQQIELIQASKINLNYGAMCDLPGNPSWGLPERVFGIPAAGGFLLTDWRESVPDTFPDGHLDNFRDATDCAGKIRHYLNRFGELRDRAEALHAQVLTHHTYANRAVQLINLLHTYAHRPSD